MKRVLRDNPDVVLMMEFWPHGLQETGVEPARLLEELEELGLVSYKAGAGKLAVFDRDEILQTGGDDCVNLVLSRNKLEV